MIQGVFIVLKQSVQKPHFTFQKFGKFPGLNVLDGFTAGSYKSFEGAGGMAAGKMANIKCNNLRLIQTFPRRRP